MKFRLAGLRAICTLDPISALVSGP